MRELKMGYVLLGVLVLGVLAFVLFQGRAPAGGSASAPAPTPAATAAGASAPVAAQPVRDDAATLSAGRVETIAAFPSAHVDPRRVTVWLPPGYDGDPEPYAVLYMHDGQNLFDPATSYGNQEWGIDEAVTRLLASGEMRRTIVVGIWNTPKRWREYAPQQPVESMAPDIREMLAAASNGAPVSDAYLRFLVEELKPFVDRTYRTRPDRANTAIMGSSMGGLISLYALMRHPDVFGAAGCVSTHWPVTTTREWLETAGDARPRTAFAAILAYMEANLPRGGGHRIYFDFGTETLDSLYEPYQQQVDALMAEVDLGPAGAWMSQKFEGAAHSEPSWRERVHIPLAFILGPTQ